MMPHQFCRRVILSSQLAAALAACSGDGKPGPTGSVPGTPVLTSIRLDAPSSSLAIGAMVQISGTPLDQLGRTTTASVSWSSANTATATVSPSGVVTGVASGATTLTVMASAGSTTVTKNMTINVMPPWAGPAPPKNLMVNNPARSRSPDIAQKEPTIAVFGSTIVVGWNDESILLGQTVRGVRNGVGFGFSTDGGVTFTDAGEMGSSGWGADPSVTTDRAGNFYFGRIDFVPGSTSLDRIAVFKSIDGGRSFPQSASAGTVDGSGINDKPTIAADNTGGQFDGTVYASWTFASSNVLRVVFSASTNGAAGFSSPVYLTDGPRDQGSFPAVGPRGELYVLWRDEGTQKLYVRKSIDGGATFAPPKLVASVSPIGEADSETVQYCGPVLNGKLRASGSPILAVDRSVGPTSGKVYVVFNSHGAGVDGSDVYLTTSADGGQTWSTPLRLNDDATSSDQFMPFVVVAPNGALAVSWYDRRLDPQNLLMDMFMRVSTDGGASFGPNLKITEVSFPPPGLNTKLGFPPYTCYMSSYNFMAADTKYFYVVWTDNRMVTSGIVDSNISFTKVPY